MNPDELRAALHRDAGLARRPSPDLLDQVIRRGRQARRRRAGVLASSLAVALVVAVVPLGMNWWGGTDQSSVGNAAPVHILDVTTRGSLAGEAELVDAVRAVNWVDADTSGLGVTANPALDTRNVVFLGDIGSTRWALVTGSVDHQDYIAWLNGPAGSSADQLHLVTSPKFVTGEEPLAMADLTTPDPTVLVIGAPGDEIEFSTAAIVDADGTVTRSYDPGQTIADGIAVTPTSVPAIRGSSFSVSRDSFVVYRSAPDWTGDSGGSATGQPMGFADPNGLASLVDGRAVAQMFYDIADGLQFPIEQLAPTLLWAGTVPGPETTVNTAAVVAVTAPSGASIVYANAFTASSGDGGYGIHQSAWQTVPAGTPVEQQPLLIRYALGDGTATQRIVTSLLLIGPSDAVRARLLNEDGAELATTDLTNGSAAILDEATAHTAEFQSDDGVVLGTATLSPSGSTDNYDRGSGAN